MSKPVKAPDAARTKPSERLPWPQTPKDLPDRPRLFRVHRVNTFEWQAYVTQGNQEFPIGKPDLFEIVAKKVGGVMRSEGQMEFLESKAKSAITLTPKVSDAA